MMDGWMGWWVDVWMMNDGWVGGYIQNCLFGSAGPPLKLLQTQDNLVSSFQQFRLTRKKTKPKFMAINYPCS